MQLHQRGSLTLTKVEEPRRLDFRNSAAVLPIEGDCVSKGRCQTPFS
jgi:hypothetical protein